MTTSIILIGPSRTGKTTLSKLLGEALSLPALDLDELRWNYYAELGYDAVKARKLALGKGLKALATYWKPFDIHALECVLRDYPNDHVIAFGWSHSVYENAAQLERAKVALSGFPHVIHILPSPDKQETYNIIRQRFHSMAAPDFPEAELDKNLKEFEEFMLHPSNNTLATMTLYTAGKSPQESCTEIVQMLAE